MFLFLALLAFGGGSAQAEDVSQCFSVREMQKTEAGRYGVHAVSNCDRVYDAVYVMVSFYDSKGKHLDDGQWAIYWCRPGRVEIHEFGIPTGARGFQRVALRGITTDVVKALGLSKDAVARSILAAPSNGAVRVVADAGPMVRTVSNSGPVRVIGDPGPRGSTPMLDARPQVVQASLETAAVE